MPNGPDDLHRSFVFFFPTPGDAAVWLSDKMSPKNSGADLTIVSGPNWMLFTNVKDQVAAAVNAGGKIERSGTTY